MPQANALDSFDGARGLGFRGGGLGVGVEGLPFVFGFRVSVLGFSFRGPKVLRQPCASNACRENGKLKWVAHWRCHQPIRES